MEAWKEQVLHEVCTSHGGDVDSTYAHALKIAQSLGFDFCAYGIRTSVPVSRPKVRTVNNYPSAWQEAYASRNYVAIDPTVASCIKSPTPLLWSALDLDGTPDHFSEQASTHGISHGCSLGCRSPDGSFGMLTFARTQGEISEEELSRLSPQLFWVTAMMHTTAASVMVPQMVPESLAGLTEREIEVLKWTADGKTSADISMIINMNERTVNYHLANATKKLCATNKTQAAVRAAMLGMFDK